MGVNKKKIFFLSASDRLNYGDLLFPILFKKILDRKSMEFDFYNFGIVKSNLTKFGGLRTYSYRCFLNKCNKNDDYIVIIGGGEVLFPNIATLYSYINRLFAFLIKSYLIKKIEKRFSICSMFLTSKKIIHPFTPSQKIFGLKKHKIFYNSVGGTFSNVDAKYREQLKSDLKKSNFISVRDSRSYESLYDFEIKSSLSPDSALIMSDFYSLKYLNTAVKSLIKLDYDYFVLQLGQNKIPDDFTVFFNNLLTYCSEKKIKIVLCPIGLAEGHNDFKILKIINSKYPETILIKPETIFEIMYIIGNSKCYMGTSLHGLITSQSYNVPFYLFNNKIPKLKSYCNTWLDEFYCDNYLEFINKIANWDIMNYTENTNYQKSLVYKNYDKMFSAF